MKRNNVTTSILIASLVVLAGLIFLRLGKKDEDNRTPTAEEMRAANVTRFKYIDSLPLATEDKKVLESHMGGPAYSDPRIAAQIAAAKAKNHVKVGPHDRPE